MRVEGKKRGLPVAMGIALASLLLGANCEANAQPAKLARPLQCRRAVIEGSVRAGQGFQQEFAGGLMFGLEPIASGWAVRVVSVNKPRGQHDYAEVATLPYQSVSPLLLSTDWSFRAQDVVGWTPRRFHFAATERDYSELADGYDAVLRGDAAPSRRAALLAEAQPQGVLVIEDATLAPGRADQVRTAAAVSTQFTNTPHTLDEKAPGSPLGRLEEVRFRVSLDLPQGMRTARGIKIAIYACPARPTAPVGGASQGISTQIYR